MVAYVALETMLASLRFARRAGRLRSDAGSMFRSVDILGLGQCVETVK